MAPDDPVDLFDIARTLWRRRLLIALSAIAFTCVGAAYAFVVTPIFRATAILIPTEAGEQSLPIPSGLSGLASLAGVNVAGNSDSTEALATLRSKVFAAEFIRDFDLLPVLFADDWDAESGSWKEPDSNDHPDIRDGVAYFTEDILLVAEDELTGLVTLGIDWVDPEEAAIWAGQLIDRINRRLRDRDLEESEQKLEFLYEQLEQSALVELRQALSQLIQSEIQAVAIAKVKEDYAFSVIDPPEVPKKKYSPRRSLIIALSGAFGLIVGGIWALGGAAIGGAPQRRDAT